MNQKKGTEQKERKQKKNPVEDDFGICRFF